MIQKRSILILGAGSAGLSVAARLRREAPELEITLIDPAHQHYYQPLWTLVGAGVLPKEATERPMLDCIPDGVNWIRDRVVAVVPEEKIVKTLEGLDIQYDQLIIAMGIQVNWQAIPGLVETLGKNSVCSNYSYDLVDYTWQSLQNFCGGEAIFTFPNTPVKCAGAPQKIMYLAEDFFRRKKVRDKSHLTFISAAPTIFGVKKYAAALEKVIHRRDIATLFRHHLVAVDGPAKTATFESLDTGERHTRSFDLLHVTPPMSAPEVIRKSTVAHPTSGWVEVDKHTLQHVRFPDVFSLGDVSSLPTSKTGAAIRKQSPVLVKNLLAYRRGEVLTAQYDGYTSCPLVTGYGKLILAEFDYEGIPRETFPFDQAKERWSMYQLKKYLLPLLYWSGMLKGRA